jgi:hypothetical protein
MAGRELAPVVDGVPMPPETAVKFEGWIRHGTRTVEDLPVTTRVVARPVWERHERRDELRELLPPSPAEIHDAILVLRDHDDRDETYVGIALHMEAFRILDGCGAA